MPARQISNAVNPILQNWLEQVGFSRGNPFGTNEADRETFLPEYFVDTGDYETIRGDPAAPRTTVVFAPRGGGKSALRVMLSSEGRPTARNSDILAVPYTRFDPIIADVQGDLRAVTVDHHLRLILKQATQTLWQALMRDAELAAAFSPEARSRFHWFCREYHPNLLSPWAVKQNLESLPDGRFDAPWPEFQQAVTAGRLAALWPRHDWRGDPHKRLVVEVVDAEPAPLDVRSLSPADLWEAWLVLALDVGLQAVYVLVDRVDETARTAGDVQAAVDLIAPLMANLPLMETPHSAFKFFLPRRMQSELLSRRAIRPDRLLFRQIVWDESLLRALLQERLLAYSEGSRRSLSSLCADAFTLDVDEALVRYADRSPRRLLHLGELLFLARCSRPATTGVQLTQKDWDRALADLQQEYIPLLRLDRQRQQVYVGERAVKLTGLEYRLLSCLEENKGWCDKEKLALQVWDAADGVTDQAISRLVRRVREKIEPDPANPIYLITERGSGFWLRHIG